MDRFNFIMYNATCILPIRLTKLFKVRGKTINNYVESMCNISISGEISIDSNFSTIILSIFKTCHKFKYLCNHRNVYKY